MTDFDLPLGNTHAEFEPEGDGGKEDAARMLAMLGDRERSSNLGLDSRPGLTYSSDCAPNTFNHPTGAPVPSVLQRQVRLPKPFARTTVAARAKIVVHPGADFSPIGEDRAVLMTSPAGMGVSDATCHEKDSPAS